MELLLRVIPPSLDAHDVRVSVEPDEPSSRLAEAVAAAVGWSSARPTLVLARTGDVLDAGQPVAASGVLSGDELLLDPPSRPLPPAPVLIRAVSVDVLAGPDSGHSAVLDRGVYLLGRDDACDVVVSDLTVSRTHLRVEVAADWRVTIEPQPDVENGLFVNDRAVTTAVEVGPDDVVTLGATRIAFREFIRSHDEARDQLGQIEFHRTPYRPEAINPTELPPLGPVPAAAEPRRFQVLAALAPLGAGLAMFAFSGEPQFLVLTLLSPLAIVANWFEDRKSGRKKSVEQVARFRERLEERKQEVAEALERERVRRVRAAPDLADLARRA